MLGALLGAGGTARCWGGLLGAGGTARCWGGLLGAGEDLPHNCCRVLVTHSWLFFIILLFTLFLLLVPFGE